MRRRRSSRLSNSRTETSVVLCSIPGGRRAGQTPVKSALAIINEATAAMPAAIPLGRRTSIACHGNELAAHEILPENSGSCGQNLVRRRLAFSHSAERFLQAGDFHATGNLLH